MKIFPVLNLIQMEELLLTSSSNAQECSVFLWNYTTGNAPHLYQNGGPVLPKTMHKIGNDYILTAEQDKPRLHLWPVNSQAQVENIRLVLPKAAQVLAVAPNNFYMAAGIGVKLYIWQISSGKLLSIQQKHFQPISCIKFSNNCEFVVVAGQDGMLVTYSFVNLVNVQNFNVPQNELGQIQALYTRLDHTLPITDCHVGNFGNKSRIATVSSDNTCRIYDIVTGDVLLNLIFKQPLTAVIFDLQCWTLFVGNNLGEIVQFNLQEPPPAVEHHVDDSHEKVNVLKGHAKKINCLDLNINNDYLVSGSEDCFVFIWQLESLQILRKIEHKGAVTNVKFCVSNVRMFEYDHKPEFIFKALEQTLNSNLQNYVVSVVQNETITFSDDSDKEDTAGLVNNLKSKLTEAKIINRNLQNTCIDMTERYYGYKPGNNK